MGIQTHVKPFFGVNGIHIDKNKKTLKHINVYSNNMDMESRAIVADLERISVIAKALTSELRVQILSALIHEVMNVNQIAEAFSIPQSSAASSVRILEEAGLVLTEQKPASKGAQKLCRAAAQDILLSFIPAEAAVEEAYLDIEMPVGLYTDFNISEPCGLLSNSGVIGYYDHPSSFLDPLRATAQLVWFAHGYLEYRFPKNTKPGEKVKSVALTAEVCSEFPGAREDWPSDITVWINGIEIGSWTSAGDMGDRRGVFTPSWWPIGNTQYGFLKTWRITENGSFVDGVRVSDVSVDLLNIDSSEFIPVRIGVKEDAANCGGLNLFGTEFGNYSKGLSLRLEK